MSWCQTSSFYQQNCFAYSCPCKVDPLLYSSQFQIYHCVVHTPSSIPISQCSGCHPSNIKQNYKNWFKICVNFPLRKMLLWTGHCIMRNLELNKNVASTSWYWSQCMCNGNLLIILLRYSPYQRWIDRNTATTNIICWHLSSIFWHDFWVLAFQHLHILILLIDHYIFN